VGYLAGKLAGKPKAGGSRFGPATNRCFTGNSVKRRIHFDGWEIACVKFEPVRLWQIMRIKDTAPVFKTPRTGANAYFVLVEKIQMESREYSVLSVGKDVTSEEETVVKT
jgi:hypothetical protein